MKPQLGPEDPLVKQALSGIFKSTCGRLFFKIDELTGEHQKVSVAKQLASLNITEHNRRCLVRAYVFTELPYASERMKQKAEALANRKPRVARLAVKEVDGYDFAQDEPIAEEQEEEATIEPHGESHCKAVKPGKSHYYLVQQGEYWGVFNAQDGGEVLFTDREQAEQYMQDLLHHREGFRAFYGKN
jgi:hypothetical protein